METRKYYAERIQQVISKNTGLRNTHLGIKLTSCDYNSLMIPAETYYCIHYDPYKIIHAIPYTVGIMYFDTLDHAYEFAMNNCPASTRFLLLEVKRKAYQRKFISRLTDIESLYAFYASRRAWKRCAPSGTRFARTIRAIQYL